MYLRFDITNKSSSPESQFQTLPSVVILSYPSSLPPSVFLIKQHSYKIPYPLDFPHVHYPLRPLFISLFTQLGFPSSLLKGFAHAISFLSPGSPFFTPSIVVTLKKQTTKEKPSLTRISCCYCLFSFLHSQKPQRVGATG